PNERNGPAPRRSDSSSASRSSSMASWPACGSIGGSSNVAGRTSGSMPRCRSAPSSSEPVSGRRRRICSVLPGSTIQSRPRARTSAPGEYCTVLTRSPLEAEESAEPDERLRPGRLVRGEPDEGVAALLPLVLELGRRVGQRDGYQVVRPLEHRRLPDGGTDGRLRAVQLACERSAPAGFPTVLVRRLVLDIQLLRLLVEQPGLDAGEPDEDLARGAVAAVDDRVVGLVVVREQAAVAAGDARVLVRVLEVLGIRHIVRRVRHVEVHDLERGARDAGKRVRLVDQTREHAGAALGGLVEQEPAALVRLRQRLAHDLALFELVDGLDAAGDAVLARG